MEVAEEIHNFSGTGQPTRKIRVKNHAKLPHDNLSALWWRKNLRKALCKTRTSAIFSQGAIVSD